MGRSGSLTHLLGSSALSQVCVFKCLLPAKCRVMMLVSVRTEVTVVTPFKSEAHALRRHISRYQENVSRWNFPRLR